MERSRILARWGTPFVVAIGVALGTAHEASAQPCVLPNNGGTVVLPDPSCPYLSPDDFHMVVDGLPAGTTIIITGIHRDFICKQQGVPQEFCNSPGGALGGETEFFDSTIEMSMQGTGLLAGFNRVINVPINCIAETGPRNPGDPVQTFPNEMVQLQGGIFGDPDFDILVVRAGRNFGLPSPGQTTLTRLGPPGSDFQVDSFFDIFYEIDFQGAPGSVLEGFAGTTRATVRMQTGGAGGDCGPDPTGQGCEPVACPDPNQICLPTCVNFDPATGAIRVLECECRLTDECHVQLPGAPAPGGAACAVVDNGSGTVTLPPDGCEYLSPDEVHLIIDGLPAGTTIELAPIHKDFICQKGDPSCSIPIPPGECEAPGGNLGGHGDCFQSTLELNVTGTGDLAGFNRTLFIPVSCEIHTAPRNPGDAVQEFDTEMVQLQGELFGDPDFCTFRVRGGTNFGLPSPGHTTLTRLGPPGSDFQVDSFFDVSYQIEFQGCPGSVLDGMAGTTTATIRMQTGGGGGGLPPCVGGCPPGTECFQEIIQLADGTFDICCNCVPITVEGACCFDSDGDGINDACQLTTPTGCQAIGGTYQGDGTVCLGIAACCFDADGDGLAEACANMDIICCEALGGTFTAGATCFGQGACCFDADGDGIDEACAVMDGVCCTAIGGSFKGPGTQCLGRGACCFDADGDGIPESCADMDEICCESFGGTFLGIGSVCLGDSNGDGADDACVPPQLDGACCFDAEGDGIPETCVIRTFQECVQLGGTYKGDGSTCLGVGACCFDADGDGLQDRCVEMDEICCESISGVFKGPGTACLGAGACCFDSNGDNIQDACFVMDGICCESFGGTFKGPGTQCLGQGACCFDADGDGIQETCAEMDGTCCESFGGSFKGPGSTCLGRGACCIGIGGSLVCVEMDEICCESSGGMFLGVNTVCLGDSDGDGNDDACVPPVCGPNAAESDCLPVACPDPNHICLPRCANYDPLTGQIRVIECECIPPDQCHVDVTGAPAPGPGGPCTVVDNGTGTVTLPPDGCEYLSPDEVHLIIDGLPAGTTIELAPIHKDFICHKGNPSCSIPIPPGECEAPGGNLGGSGDCFQSTLELNVTGTGDLAGFNRTLFVQVDCEIHTGPRNPGDGVQDFDTEMVQLQGELFGDPDFCTFRVRGGSNFGLPSPGHTTLTRLGPPGSDFQVDSFFDVFYEIEFQGCPGSALDGMAGTTQAVIRMQTGGAGGVPPCVGDCPPGTECVQTIITLADGTLDVCCDCVPVEPEGACCFDSDSDGINESCTVTTQTGCFDLAGGTYQGDGTVCLGQGACCFGITGGACVVVDEICCDDINGVFLGQGTVCLGDANGDGQDDACVPPDCGPNIDESACLQVVCPDDPTHQCLPREVVFDPFTGEVRVAICECVDINECHVATLGDPIACPPAPVGGASCVQPNAAGTVTLPPPGCPYVSPEDAHMIIDGLPPGTEIIVGAEHMEFGLQNSGPGGNLGGEFEQFSSILVLQICGTGDLAGYNRFFNVPVDCETHTGPRTPGDAVQSFDTDFFRLQGELFGDPDFCTFRVRGGTSFGLPSPGHTTLTRLGPPGSNFVVDSFFDVEYQIDFVGCPGGPLDGLAGTTTATIRMKTGGMPDCVGGCPPGQICERTEVVLADGRIRIRCECVDDVPPCPWDFDGDGVIGFQDLLKVLAQWGPCPAVCPWDFDGDGVVGFQDLLKLLAQWGPCPG